MEGLEAEARIAALLRQVREVVREYGGTSGYLDMAIIPAEDGCRASIRFCNMHWPGGRDEGRPLDWFEFDGEEVDAGGAAAEEDPVRVP